MLRYLMCSSALLLRIPRSDFASLLPAATSWSACPHHRRQHIAPCLRHVASSTSGAGGDGDHAPIAAAAAAAASGSSSRAGQVVQTSYQAWRNTWTAFLAHCWDRGYFSADPGVKREALADDTGAMKRAVLSLARQRRDILHSLDPAQLKSLVTADFPVDDRKTRNAYKRLQASVLRGKHLPPADGGPAELQDVMRLFINLAACDAREAELFKPLMAAAVALLPAIMQAEQLAPATPAALDTQRHMPSALQQADQQHPRDSGGLATGPAALLHQRAQRLQRQEQRERHDQSQPGRDQRQQQLQQQQGEAQRWAQRQPGEGQRRAQRPQDEGQRQDRWQQGKGRPAGGQQQHSGSGTGDGRDARRRAGTQCTAVAARCAVGGQVWRRVGRACAAAADPYGEGGTSLMERMAWTGGRRTSDLPLLWL